MLSKKELFKLFSDQRPRRVPVIPFVMQYAAKIAGIAYRDYCKNPESMAESQLRCLEEFDYDAVNVSSDAHRLAEALGGELFFPEDGVPVVKDPPIKSAEDLKGLSVPDPTKAERCRQRIRAIELLNEQRPEVTVIGWVEGALSDASSIFGPTNAMKALYRDKTLLKQLFRFSAEFDRKFARAQVEAGADIIGAGDSLASQISTENFELSVEYTKEIFRSLDVPTLYHVCGDTTHQLEVLRESQVDIVDLDREVDLAQAREVLGPDMVIRGNVDPVLFVQGEPTRIEELSTTCIRDAGEEYPFILSAGCEIPPDSRRENLEAMVRTAKSQG
ncbi:MAG: uroporphyrinogen decarboxylase family protein [Candidatus Bipolaricaulota bacterium]|nr:uroporphyrinogen decarboxylase family protein [Candidatus Bipolaricaulota bacterium]